MEINNNQYIEIISTLEMIERTNNAIKFHLQLEKPDLLAIKQYEKLKANYIEQLSKLLSVFNIQIQHSNILEYS